MSSASPPDSEALAAEPPAARPLDLRKLAIRLLVGVALLFAAGFGAAALFGPALERLGGWFVERYGAAGVAVSVAALDTSPIPLISEPVFLLALSGGLQPTVVFVAASIGALTAAPCGYLLGWSLGQLGLTRRVLGDEDQERARDLVSRYGVWGVALAALTPLPFAACTWSAGVLRMRLLPFFVGSLFRVPKVAFYVWLVHQAWQAARTAPG